MKFMLQIQPDSRSIILEPENEADRALLSGLVAHPETCNQAVVQCEHDSQRPPYRKVTKVIVSL